MKREIGEVFEGQVRDIAADGRAVVEHPDGRIFFVPGVWLGERIEVKVLGFKGRSGVGRCQTILSPSPHRVTPQCKHQGSEPGRCGGCPWQFASYDSQLAVKQARIEKYFEGLGFKDVNPIQGSPSVFGFRNRAQLKSDGQRLGFLSEQSHILAPVEDCIILNATTRELLKTMLASLPNARWQPSRKTPWVSLDVDDQTAADDIVINQRRPFRQANNAQNSFMQKWLAEHLSALDPCSTVLELFSGSGNFTLVMSKLGFERIVAVEGVGDACAALKAAQLPGVEVLQADLFSDIGLRQALKRAVNANILVLDPPRDGMKSTDPLFAKNIKFRDVFYISCDLATLVRDVKKFQQQRFKLREVQPLDQSPHTPHIEVLVHLSRR